MRVKEDWRETLVNLVARRSGRSSRTLVLVSMVALWLTRMEATLTRSSCEHRCSGVSPFLAPWLESAL